MLGISEQVAQLLRIKSEKFYLRELTKEIFNTEIINRKKCEKTIFINYFSDRAEAESEYEEVAEDLVSTFKPYGIKVTCKKLIRFNSGQYLYELRVAIYAEWKRT